jgi:hypothetical protein
MERAEDPVGDYFDIYVNKEYLELSEFFEARGLSENIINIIEKGTEEHLKHLAGVLKARNEFAVFVNARERKLTYFEAIRNLLYLRIKIEASEKGLNSTLNPSGERDCPTPRQNS